MQKLLKETDSGVVEEQEEVLSKQIDYVHNCIVPLKEIYAKLYEDCANLE